MNAKALKQTSVTSTLCVTTLKDPMSVAALVVIWVMEEIAQVNVIRTVFMAKIHHVASEGIVLLFYYCVELEM